MHDNSICSFSLALISHSVSNLLSVLLDWRLQYKALVGKPFIQYYFLSKFWEIVVMKVSLHYNHTI